MQDVFRGLEQRGGFKRLLDWSRSPRTSTGSASASRCWPGGTAALLADVRDRPPQRARGAEGARPRHLPRLDRAGGRRRHAAQGTAGFQALTQKEQDRLLVYVGGSTSVSAPRWPARHAAQRPEGQARPGRDVHQVPHDEKGLSQLVGATADLRLPSTGTELEGPTEVKHFKFASGKADALRYVAKIGAVAEARSRSTCRRTSINASGTLFLPSVNDVVDILSRGPEQVRRMVKEVHVNPGRNPADACWATQPGLPSSRTSAPYMTAGADGIVDIYPSTTPHNADVGRTSIAHESGHTVSQKLWGTDTNSKKWKPWRDAMKSDGISASTYATSSPTRTSPSTGRCSWRSRRGPREEELRIAVSRPAGRSWRRCGEAPGHDRVRRRGDRRGDAHRARGGRAGVSIAFADGVPGDADRRARAPATGGRSAPTAPTASSSRPPTRSRNKRHKRRAGRRIRPRTAGRPSSPCSMSSASRTCC